MDAESIFREYGHRIYSVALRILQNESDAADATQNAMLSLIRYGVNYRGDSAPWTWLYRIAVNAAYELLRRRSRRQRHEVYGLSISTIENAARNISVPAADEIAALRETETALDAAVADLPEPYRWALERATEYDPDPTLATLECSIPAHKSRLHRARRRIAESLAAAGVV